MQRLILSLGLAALAIVSAACSDAASASPTPARLHPGRRRSSIVAKDLAFQPTEVAAPADQPFTIVLDNQEDVPHNIAIKDATGAVVFKGEIVNKGQEVNAIPALAAGSYPFLCEVHPDMTGTITAS